MFILPIQRGEFGICLPCEMLALLNVHPVECETYSTGAQHIQLGRSLFHRGALEFGIINFSRRAGSSCVDFNRSHVEYSYHHIGGNSAGWASLF